MDLPRFLIGLGLVILIIGIMWPILSRVGLGRLPGDIMFKGSGTTFYFPVVTCIIISLVHHHHSRTQRSVVVGQPVTSGLARLGRIVNGNTRSRWHRSLVSPCARLAHVECTLVDFPPTNLFYVLYEQRHRLGYRNGP